jgi:hypothetical protein
MPILDEIEAYFAKQSDWQQCGYAALRSGKALDDALVTELTAQCIKEVSGTGNQPEVTQTTAQSATAPEKEEIVCLLGVENVQHINRLAPAQSLKFAVDGLTIVYGDNGAGKTGYGKILRQVCQARGEAPMLRSSVYEDGAYAGSAEVIFSVNGVEERTTIPVAQQQAGLLRHFSIFDSAAANVLVNEQNTTAFRPFGLDLLDRFTSLSDLVKQSIEREMTSIGSPLVQSADFPETTEAGRLLRGLATEGGRKDLESRLVPLTVEQEARREEVRGLLVQAKNNDPVKLAQGINAKATRYQQFGQRLGVIAAGLSSEGIQNFVALRTQTLEVEEAAEVARSSAFKNEPLKEVGAGVWRQLWDAARAYAPHAGTGQSFATSKAGDLCVLCAQPLSADAANRFQTLEGFVQGELQPRPRHYENNSVPCLMSSTLCLCNRPGTMRCFKNSRRITSMYRRRPKRCSPMQEYALARFKLITPRVSRSSRPQPVWKSQVDFSDCPRRCGNALSNCKGPERHRLFRPSKPNSQSWTQRPNS